MSWPRRALQAFVLNPRPLPPFQNVSTSFRGLHLSKNIAILQNSLVGSAARGPYGWAGPHS
jgi:hypothetical protein